MKFFVCFFVIRMSMINRGHTRGKTKHRLSAVFPCARAHGRSVKMKDVVFARLYTRRRQYTGGKWLVN